MVEMMEIMKENLMVKLKGGKKGHLKEVKMERKMAEWKEPSTGMMRETHLDSLMVVTKDNH